MLEAMAMSIHNRLGTITANILRVSYFSTHLKFLLDF